MLQKFGVRERRVGIWRDWEVGNGDGTWTSRARIKHFCCYTFTKITLHASTITLVFACSRLNLTCLTVIIVKYKMLWSLYFVTVGPPTLFYHIIKDFWINFNILGLQIFFIFVPLYIRKISFKYDLSYHYSPAFVTTMSTINLFFCLSIFHQKSNASDPSIKLNYCFPYIIVLNMVFLGIIK